MVNRVANATSGPLLGPPLQDCKYASYGQAMARPIYNKSMVFKIFRVQYGHQPKDLKQYQRPPSNPPASFDVTVIIFLK
jgi:hypothetical protein